MNLPTSSRRAALRAAALAPLAACVLLLATPEPAAAPGAHGPNGEHLDEARTAAGGAALPRVEARSELFELVAQLKAGELSILVDRYETNEPVLGARLDVESGAHKATASFRADAGDYVVSDPALLKALAAPGEHALVFTLVAGDESDLLDGTLVAAAGDGHGHVVGSGPSGLARLTPWLGAAVALLAAAAALRWRRRRSGAGGVALEGERS